MKKALLVFAVVGLLLIGANAFAADGDLIVDGKLGIGTTTSPANILQIQSAGSSSTSDVTNQLYTSVLTAKPRLLFQKSHSDSAANVATIDGEQLGQINWYGNSGSGFTVAAGITVNQTGSAGTTTPAYMMFHTTNGSGWTERMRIDQNGNVGIGTTTPGSKLSLGSSLGNTKLALYDDGTYYYGLGIQGNEFRFHVYGPQADFKFIDAPAGNTLMTIKGSGKVGIGTTTPSRLLSVGTGGAGSDGAAWYTSSSREYKDNVQELSAEKASEAVRNMKPVTFVYKDIPGYNHVGFIAEDVPNLVATPDRKSLSAMDIVAVLTKVVQEQQKEIEKLKSDMVKMKAKDMVSGVYSP